MICSLTDQCKSGGWLQQKLCDDSVDRTRMGWDCTGRKATVLGEAGSDRYYLSAKWCRPWSDLLCARDRLMRFNRQRRRDTDDDRHQQQQQQTKAHLPSHPSVLSIYNYLLICKAQPPPSETIQSWIFRDEASVEEENPNPNPSQTAPEEEKERKIAVPRKFPIYHNARRF